LLTLWFGDMFYILVGVVLAFLSWCISGITYFAYIAKRNNQLNDITKDVFK